MGIKATVVQPVLYFLRVAGGLWPGAQREAAFHHPVVVLSSDSAGPLGADQDPASGWQGPPTCLTPGAD